MTGEERDQLRIIAGVLHGAVDWGNGLVGKEPARAYGNLEQAAGIVRGKLLELIHDEEAP